MLCAKNTPCLRVQCETGVREQTAPYTRSNRSRRYQTLIKLHRIASSPTHLVLQAYCLTDVSKFGTEQQDVFRYSMVSRQFGRCPKSIELYTQPYSYIRISVNDWCIGLKTCHQKQTRTLCVFRTKKSVVNCDRYSNITWVFCKIVT